MQNFIFDLYGTLVDIRTDEQSQKFRRRFNAYFKTVNPEIQFFSEYFPLCDKLKSSGGENCEIDLSRVFDKLAGARSREAALVFRQFSTQYIKPYRGVKRFLAKLKACGKRLFILSNAQSCFTLPELEKLKIAGLFDGIVISSDFGRKKPDAEFFEFILAKYSLDPKDSIYIGNDLCADICGARAVNLKTAYVLSNLSPVSDNMKKADKEADFACDNHKRLFEYLLSL